MPLDKPSLIADIRAAFADAKTKEDNTEAVFAKLALDIANAIDTFVKSGVVTGTTASSCTTGGAVGTCTGTMS